MLTTVLFHMNKRKNPLNLASGDVSVWHENHKRQDMDDCMCVTQNDDG